MVDNKAWFCLKTVMGDDDLVTSLVQGYSFAGRLLQVLRSPHNFCAAGRGRLQLHLFFYPHPINITTPSSHLPASQADLQFSASFALLSLTVMTCTDTQTGRGSSIMLTVMPCTHSQTARCSSMLLRAQQPQPRWPRQRWKQLILRCRAHPCSMVKAGCKDRPLTKHPVQMDCV